MGHIFRPKYKDKKTGEVRESGIWWIKYHRNGRPYFESAKTREETKAKRLLRKMEGEIADGRIPGIYFDKTTYKELRDNFLIYRRQEKGAKSEKDAMDRTRHLDLFFGSMKAAKITTPKVREYIKQRLEEEAARGRIFHDFRRTAVRDMVRAGISEKIAMTISGHKTRSVFERYNIVNDRDLREALERKLLYHQAQKELSGVSLGESHSKNEKRADQEPDQPSNILDFLRCRDTESNCGHADFQWE